MILWKNVDLKSLGIITEKIPKIPKAKKKIDIYEVEGRSGFLSVDTNNYEPFTINLECHCQDTANFDLIKNLLDGFGTLSFDGIRQYTAIVDNTIPFEQVQNFKKFQISFLVNPICENILSTTIDLLESNTFNIDSYTDVYPNLIIECSGDISVDINGNIFYLNNTNGSYTLDCKNKVIYDSNMQNASNLMLYDFPKFKPGNNLITTTGNISSFTAIYKETFL